MIKKVLSTLLLGASLILSGCGSSDGKGESALETQQLLDNGEFDSVIQKVGIADSTSDYLSLASAYMGRAGFSLSSIIGIVASSAESGENSTFASFIESANENSNSRSLQDLRTAVGYYQKVVGDRCLAQNTNLSSAESDLCLYIGLSQISQTSVAMGLIIGDINVLNDSGASDDKLSASLCAMQYAFDGDARANSACNISVESDVTFTQSGQTYGRIIVTIDNNQTFDYLLAGTNNPRSTVLTNGFCTLDSFATRVDDTNDTSYYICPLNESNTTQEITTENILVQALNDGTSSVGAAVSDEVSTNIEQFRQDIIGSRTNNDTNTTISIEDIIQYLDTNNK